MENWEWTTGRSADEIGAYIAHALGILKNAGLTCEGVTTPGGFGNRALPQLAQGTLQAVRSVFGTEIPHYFRHMFTEGPQSVAPRVEYASGLDGPDPRCVVSIIAYAGDWTGGWDNVTPGGVDKALLEKSRRLGGAVQRPQRLRRRRSASHSVFWPTARSRCSRCRSRARSSSRIRFRSKRTDVRVCQPRRVACNLLAAAHFGASVL